MDRNREIIAVVPGVAEGESDGGSRRWRVAAAAIVLVVISGGCGRRPAEPLRTVGEVTRLPERDLAQGLRVELRGVITLADPAWQLLAIQDATGGMLVEWPVVTANVRLGDLVEVTGATSVDNHVPSVVTASLGVLATGSLPKPLRATADSVACGESLFRRVEVELRPDQGSMGDDAHFARFTTRGRCGALVAIGRMFRQPAPEAVVGRRIRVRGVPLAFYSPSGALDHVRLMFDDQSDVDILEAPAKGAEAPGDLPEIRTIRAIKALSRSEADRGYPVRVEGVVVSPNGQGPGYTLHDGSIGINVFTPPGGVEALGQRLRVTGRTAKGGFAPVIVQSSNELLGTGPLPKPVRVDPDDAFHGWEDNGYVTVEGLVAAVAGDQGRHHLELFSGSRRVMVWIGREVLPSELQRFVGAKVAATGVYGPLFTAGGALGGFRVHVTAPAMVKVIEPAPASSEFRSLASLVQFDIRGFPGRQIRTAGAVTYRDARGRVYLQDAESAIRVIGNGSGDPPVGSWATVEGFLAPDSPGPQLEHVRWVSSTPAAAAPAPAAALAESLVSGDYDSRLITVEGFLESRRTSGGELQLNLLAGRSRFTASLEAPASVEAFPDLRPGALLRLTGVCSAQRDAGGSGTRLARVWLRQPGDIVVVTAAPWWDLERVVYVTVAAFLLLLAVLAWVVRLRQNLVAQMVLRSKLEEQLMHAQKLESVGRLAGGVAHDFNNYLTVVLGYTALLLEAFPKPGTVRQQLTTIREVAEKAASLTKQLLAFSRKQVMQPAPCDLNEIITNAQSALLPLIGEHIEIVMRQRPVDKVSIDPAQFLQVLVNLAVNARDAMPDGGKLTFETANKELGAGEARLIDGLAPGRYVRVTVADTGVGMDAATRQRVFEPFFTTKEQGKGTGLGLAVVFGIIKQSNGHIEVESKPGEGSRFRIYLPVAEKTATQPELQAHTTEGKGAEAILVVEDQAAVRTLIRMGLEAHGYKVLEAPSPIQALKTLDDPAVPIDLLLTDIVMPEMSGRALAAQAVEKRPGLRVLLMSGHSEEILADQGSGQSESFAYLQKPFTPSQAAAAVRAALNAVSK